MIDIKELLDRLEVIKSDIKKSQDEALKIENEVVGFYMKKSIEEEIENTCNCNNCACSDECDGEFYDDMVTVVDTEINDLGIWITEDEDGERFVMLNDLVDGERVELNEAELNVIVAMMGL